MGKALSIAMLPVLVLSGILGKKVAALVWKQVTGEPPPDTADEQIRWPQLIPAAVIEGTAFMVSRMLLDRGVRMAVARSTGSWPGERGQGQ